MNIDKKTARKQFDISKRGEAYEIKGFAGVLYKIGPASKGSGYEYFFASRSVSREIVIPDEIDGLPVTKVAVKCVPDDAVVFCRGTVYAKLPRAAKAGTARVFLENPSRFETDEAEQIEQFIKKYSEDTAAMLSGSDCPDAYVRFYKIAAVKPEITERLIAGAGGNAEIKAFLLDQTAQKASAESFSMDSPKKYTVAEYKKLWTWREYSVEGTKDKEIVLTNYKGSDEHVVIPAALGKKRISRLEGQFPAHVVSIEFESEDLEIACSFRNCKAMADGNGFVVVQVGSRAILTDYLGPKDVPCLSVPDGVTEICYGVLQDLQALEIILPEGLKEIGSHEFSKCSRLQQIIFPESLCKIGQMAFSGCSALEELYIPENVSEIAYQHARNTGLKIVYGVSGSAAEAFAQKEHLTFVAGGRPLRKDDTE